MKVLSVIVETAVTYHEPDDRKPGRILSTGAETYPVAEPSETSIPETPNDFVVFQVKNSEGRVLLQLAISEYFQVVGVIDDDIVIDENRHLRRPKIDRTKLTQI